MNIIRFKRPKRWRLLRTYTRVAEKQYSCLTEECPEPICEGDQYEAEVWVTEHGIWVKRWHVMCPMDPDDEREYRRRLADDTGTNPQKLAA